MNIFTSNLYKRLTGFCTVDIFTHGKKGCVRLNENVHIFHLDQENLVAFAEEVMEHHMLNQYDIVHTHYWLSGIIGLHLKKTAKVPWVHTFHTIELFKTLKRNQQRMEIEEEITRSCDVIISPTIKEKGALTAHFPKTQVITIPHGVDTTKFKARVNGSSNLLYVGRIDPIKGLELLIDALRLLKQDLRLDVVGGPSQKQGDTDSIKSYAKGLRVGFSGPVDHDELTRYYHEAAMVILPSYYESFGLVALEAMASARPVVGFQDTGLSETVGTRAGILVERDTRELARAISLLIHNKTVRHNLGTHGNKVIKNYDWSHIARIYAKTYEELAKN
jgi:glycosyltransferase involved in cell wall biosynthesis